MNLVGGSKELYKLASGYRCKFELPKQSGSFLNKSQQARPKDQLHPFMLFIRDSLA